MRALFKLYSVIGFGIGYVIGVLIAPIVGGGMAGFDGFVNHIVKLKEEFKA